MEIIDIIRYIALGLTWTIFLEYFSTRYPDETGEIQGWSNKERIAHTLFWPLGFILFIIFYIRQTFF